MDKPQFEGAIRRALSASPNNGAKWRPFERLFTAEGLRGGGAITNQHAEQGTRIRQLLTLRPDGAGVRAHSRYCILVLNQEQAQRSRSHPERSKDSIVKNLGLERSRYLPPEEGLESVLVLRRDSTELVPIVLVKWGDSAMTRTFLEWYPGVDVVDLSGELLTAKSDGSSPKKTKAASENNVVKPGENTIFFGPPGTGKSYRIKEQTVDFFDIIHTVFHPEYSYADFVGSYKPVCGRDPGSQILSFDGQSSIDRPIVYYDFEPGVLIRAIVRAHQADGAPVALVIDELNRGDCAAIFGDFIQLLDRADSGRSEYGINVGLPLGAYLVGAGVSEAVTDKVFLPANLHLLATLNTSDQALLPMDSAFKRRWSWQAVPVDKHPDLQEVAIPAVGGSEEMAWLHCVEKLNEIILKQTENEDKRIGPWYIRAQGDTIPVTDVRNKLLYYLWHDVFRGYTEGVFFPHLRTFDAVQDAFDAGGLPAVLSGFAADSAPADLQPQAAATGSPE